MGTVGNGYMRPPLFLIILWKKYDEYIWELLTFLFVFNHLPFDVLIFLTIISMSSITINKDR